MQPRPPQRVVRPVDQSLAAAIRLALIFAAIKLALHVVANLWEAHIGYGYFRDELYYLICGRHLAWGYVDHGPIVALQAGSAISSSAIRSSASACSPLSPEPCASSSPACSPGRSAAADRRRSSP